MLSRLSVHVLFASCALFASEVRIEMKDLPDPVRKTIEKETRNAELRGLTREDEHGRTNYEAETTVNGRERDLLIDASGNIVEVEERTDLARIPEAARNAFRQAAGAGRVLKVESVRRGSTVSYEAVIRRNGKISEVAVNADGNRAKEE